MVIDVTRAVSIDQLVERSVAALNRGKRGRSLALRRHLEWLEIVRGDTGVVKYALGGRALPASSLVDVTVIVPLGGLAKGSGSRR